MTIDTSRNLRISPAVYVGGYVDERKGKGAVLVIRNELTHLDVQKTRQVIAYLQACIEEPEK